MFRLIFFFYFYSATLFAKIPGVCFSLHTEVQTLVDSDFFVNPARADQIATITELGATIYKIRVKDGPTFVMRFNGAARGQMQKDDLAFERFASSVYNKLGFTIPNPIEVNLSNAVRDKMVSKLAGTSYAAKFREVTQGEDLQASVLSFYPLKLGYDYLNENFGKATSGEAIWSQLSAKMREQLADIYAINLSLGINDSHSSNWLTDGKDVVPIDLAYRSGTFTSGIIDIKKVPWSFPVGPVTDRDQLARDGMSARVRNGLKKLTPADLKKLASDAGLAISDAQIQAVLYRINFILNDKS